MNKKKNVRSFYLALIKKVRLRRSKRDFERLSALIATPANRQDGLFNAEWYEKTYPDVVSEGQTATYHYLHHGYKEGRDPGPNFDTRFYLTTYPDVGASGLNPLLHYILHGRAEGRQCRREGSFDWGQLEEPRQVIVKELAFTPGNDAAVLVAHAPTGRLKPHVLPYIEQLSNAGLQVLLVAIVDQPLELLEKEINVAAGIIVRDNAGYDFSAWTDALQIFPALFGAGLLVITNDSVVPTVDTDLFAAMMTRVRKCTADVVALTASHEYGWHVQSYFLGLRPKALSSWAFQHFVRELRRIDDKDEVIRTYEVPFATKMQAAGLTVQALYAGSYSANPTFFSWRELIEQGFPFVKLLMLRDKFEKVTDQAEVLKEVRQQWPHVLKNAGFDVELVHSALRAAELSSAPPGPNWELLVNIRQFDAITEDHPLRIAFFGPWNYENGLGAASREILSALHRLDARINAYPIVKPFHTHRLICPTVETIDFRGRPDIAIVHLNPDCWNFLTSEQRAIIRSAKQRIGYWVWETDTLPPAWQQELRSVDRVWAPSTYCAGVFSVEMNVPVDVVPHPVHVPARTILDREAILHQFGIDPKLRLILYIFDGASNLVRKNPDGLIRAFAMSGLAERGWALVLKTKHLHDRPETGVALAELADATPAVHILDGSFHSDEIISLMAAADIYASPHCSEGFGLTVAEAMAAGKPVVATDYSGTRDFLDEKCGYPIPAATWTLDRNYGDYLIGHSWAKVDEGAFAAALVKAADALVSGDYSIGKAAKTQITNRLSYDAVTDTIKASISAAIEDSRVPKGLTRGQRKIAHVQPPPQVNPDFSSAKRFCDFPRSEGIVPVPLENDLSWDGHAIPEGSPDDWLLFAPRNAFISPDAHYSLLISSTNRPDVSLFYADDVAAGGDMLNRLNLKPDFNYTLLVAQDYIGAPVAVRRKMLTDLEGLNRSCGTAVLYDLILRVADAGGVISRIADVLIGYSGERPVPDLWSRHAALLSQKRFADVALVEGRVPGQLLQRRRFASIGYPTVTIVIPTQRTLQPRSAETYIEALLTNIARATWPMDRITVMVGDDIMGVPDWAKHPWPFKLKRIETPRPLDEPFNYSAKMNRLWREASDEHIIFLNDDALPTTPNWLEALLSFAVDESVGGVGARLHYADGSIQHVGMFPAFCTVVHAWLGWPNEAKTYNDWAVAQREWSVVTGAVFATRLSILKRINGFDERFSLEFNDVDLCLRIRNMGYKIVYNPDAQFTHAEKASRGSTPQLGEEVALFLSRWGRWLDNDPASHPGYSTKRLDIAATAKENAWYL
ncbi:rhamnan synthesis F family protein [Sphingobium subterraneum]|uniref:Glycosyltransferase involved in cell wall biosynthesis n=1 Tax=Sphingobium subterraneum TaxID=627688 RepID=A0A841J6B3_9SPHN|nr:rhamnan synthesis F family protein [Sphingobium subterraneum]MBB6123751.1 glycosyltransferase involved in cell wall biosynthesis [Sphingobium subterraneum]